MHVSHEIDADPLPFAEVNFILAHAFSFDFHTVALRVGTNKRYFSVNCVTLLFIHPHTAFLNVFLCICTVQVLVVNRWSGQEVVVAKTRGWAPQAGASLQWGVSDSQLFYNDVVHGKCE